MYNGLIDIDDEGLRRCHKLALRRSNHSANQGHSYFFQTTQQLPSFKKVRCQQVETSVLKRCITSSKSAITLLANIRVETLKKKFKISLTFSFDWLYDLHFCPVLQPMFYAICQTSDFRPYLHWKFVSKSLMLCYTRDKAQRKNA